jgi:hypothetical protein
MGVKGSSPFNGVTKKRKNFFALFLSFSLNILRAPICGKEFLLQFLPKRRKNVKINSAKLNLS